MDNIIYPHRVSRAGAIEDSYPPLGCSHWYLMTLAAVSGPADGGAGKQEIGGGEYTTAYSMPCNSMMVYGSTYSFNI